MLEMRDTQTPHTGNRQLVRRRLYYSTKPGAQLLGGDTGPCYWAQLLLTNYLLYSKAGPRARPGSCCSSWGLG